jgi:hypothetical protein
MIIRNIILLHHNTLIFKVGWKNRNEPGQWRTDEDQRLVWE